MLSKVLKLTCLSKSKNYWYYWLSSLGIYFLLFTLSILILVVSKSRNILLVFSFDPSIIKLFAYFIILHKVTGLTIFFKYAISSLNKDRVVGFDPNIENQFWYIYYVDSIMSYSVLEYVSPRCWSICPHQWTEYSLHDTSTVYYE